MTALLVPSLTVNEVAELDAHERTIERGLKTFYEVGSALLAIRDSRLYRADHGTFEDYCRERWGWERRHAYRLMDAATVVGNVSNWTQTPPATESQARPLTRLDTPEQQREAWTLAQQLAADNTPDGKVTAVWVEAAVAHIKNPETTIVTDAEPLVYPVRPERMAVHYSSASPEWYTPAHIIAAVVDFFDTIDLDPCAEEGDPKTVPARVHLTAADDGLSREWFGRVYMNPPYGDAIQPWIAKLDAAYRAREIEAGIALVPARPDTAWFRILRDYPRCFINGRLKFGGHEDSAPFPSVLVYLGDEVARFAGAVAHLGDVYVRLETTV